MLCKQAQMHAACVTGDMEFSTSKTNLKLTQTSQYCKIQICDYRAYIINRVRIKGLFVTSCYILKQMLPQIHLICKQIII